VSSPKNKQTDPHVSVPKWFEDKRFWETTYPLIFAEEAKSRAELEKLDIEWVQEDMRSFVRPDEFELAISLFTSFGYFGDEEKASSHRSHISQNTV